MSSLCSFAHRCRYVPLLAALTIFCIGADAEWSGHDGWVEEPDARSLNVGGEPGHAYLDSGSVHRGSDGLVYFNESTNVLRPEQIGKTGFMTDAYDCTKDIKYMCVGSRNWRDDTKSALHTTADPALPVYRKYLCGDVQLKR
jgi:hypothetical protein